MRKLSNSPAPYLILLAAMAARAQDLAPRAYLVTPKGSNAVTISYVWNNGELVFDPAVPIKDAKGRFSLSILSYYHSYSLFGRSANIVVSVPYALGNFHGEVAGTFADAYRSGLADSRVRVSVNLRGGPAMRVKEFLEWRERTLVGVSITAIVPNGQYDPARLINTGTNRWAFKPEIGFTRRRGRWVGEGYAGVWIFTSNPQFFPGSATRAQHPMRAFEGHLGYYLKPRLWVSLDGNYWSGGNSTMNGVENQDAQRASRLGVSFSTPVSRRQSLKFSYSRGAYVRLGGNFDALSAAWQYSWLGKAK